MFSGVAASPPLGSHLAIIGLGSIAGGGAGAFRTRGGYRGHVHEPVLDFVRQSIGVGLVESIRSTYPQFEQNTAHIEKYGSGLVRNGHAPPKVILNQSQNFRMQRAALILDAPRRFAYRIGQRCGERVCAEDELR